MLDNLFGMKFSMANTVQANQQVLIRLPSDTIRILAIKPGEIVNLGRFGSFDADSLIGQPFGYTYKIHADRSIQPLELQEFATEDALGNEQSMDGHKIAFETEQELTMEEIENLKQQGVDSDEIIRRIQSGHAGFEAKSEYSKEKYLKRKKSKYAQQFTPEPMSVEQVLDIYLDKDAARAQNMSIETLALALNYANVHEGGHYLVFDETPGVWAAAVRERGGEVTMVHVAEHANVDAFRYLPQLTNSEENKLHSIPLLDLISPDEIEPEIPEQTPEELAELKPSLRGQYYRRRAHDKAIRDTIEYSRIRGFDGLIVASSVVISDLIPRLLPFVAGGCPVVVYSQYKEPLVDAALQFRKHELRLLAPELMETRVRKFQTLPGRIHPLMSSPYIGGYLLHGLRVYPDASASAIGRHTRSRKRVRTDDSSRSATPGITDLDSADSELGSTTQSLNASDIETQ